MTRENYNMRTPIEAVTKAVPVIPTDHEANHLGWGYSASVFAEGVADNGYVQLEFKTPATLAAGAVHLKSYRGWAEGGLATLEIIEAPTLTTGNTAFVPKNRRRTGTPPTSGCTLKTDPTSISAGTTIEGPIACGGGGAGGGAGGNVTQDQELVLNENTTYLIRVQNLAGSAKALGLWIFWYEELETLI